MKSMTFGLPKTVSNVFIPDLGCLHDIYIFSLRKKTKNLCCFVHFPQYWEKITRCRMRTLGTVLETLISYFSDLKKCDHKNSSRRTPRHSVHWKILIFSWHNAALCVNFTHSEALCQLKIEIFQWTEWRGVLRDEFLSSHFFTSEKYDIRAFQNRTECSHTTSGYFFSISWKMHKTTQIFGFFA